MNKEYPRALVCMTISGEWTVYRRATPKSQDRTTWNAAPFPTLTEAYKWAAAAVALRRRKR